MKYIVIKNHPDVTEVVFESRFEILCNLYGRIASFFEREIVYTIQEAVS